MTEHYLLEDVPHKLGTTNDSTELDSGKYLEMQSPMTPSQKLIRLLGSPGRYINRKFSPGSLKGSVFTILASTIGAGILTLPYAMNLVGLYLGIFVFVLGMWVSLYSCNLLIKCADALKISTYEGVGAKLYGKKMGKLCEINMIINNYGTAVAYIVLLKGIFPNALSQFGIDNALATNEFLWGTLITTLVIFPLSLCKEISALRYTSFISFLTCTYLAIVVVAEFFILKGGDSGKEFADAPPARFTLFSIFEVCPLVVFAYTCHPNVMPIYDELQRRTVKRGNKFLFRGLLLVMILYIFVGVFGFLSFYDEYDELTDFPSQILTADYNDGDPLVIIATLAIAFTVLAGSPLVIYPCRDAFFSAFWGDTEVSKKMYVIVVSGLVFTAMLLALFIPDVSMVLTVLGSVSNPMICFILPCMFYLKTFPGPWKRRDRLMCYVVMVSMVIVGIMGFVMFWVDLAGIQI